jgi:hypothetical protein
VTPHDAPSAAELIEAVREWLEAEVVAATDGRLQFHGRVAVNMLAIVEREMKLGAVHIEAHHARLRQLGAADDAALAAAIRAGQLDDRLAEVRALVWESVRDKLAVANPKYLDLP